MKKTLNPSKKLKDQRKYVEELNARKKREEKMRIMKGLNHGLDCCCDNSAVIDI